MLKEATGRCRSWRSGENAWVLNPALTTKLIIGGGGQWQRDLQEPGQQQVSVDESGMAVTSEVPCYFTPMLSAADRKAGAARSLACFACLLGCLLACKSRTFGVQTECTLAGTTVLIINVAALL